MTNAAVAETESKTSTGAEAKAGAVEATQSQLDEALKGGASAEGKGTPATEQKVQTGEQSSQESEPAKTPPSPSEDAAAAKSKATLNEMARRLHNLEGDYNSVDEVEAALLERQYTRREEELETKTQSLYVDLRKGLTERLGSIEVPVKNPAGLAYVDENQKPITVKLGVDEIEKALGPMNELRANVRQLEQMENLQELADIALDLIPEKAWDAFSEAVTGKGPNGENATFDSWLEAVIEHAASATKAWRKELGEREAFGKAEYARGWEDAKGAPGGEPDKRGGTGATPTSIEGKSPREVAAMIKSGEIDPAAELRKLGAR